MLTVSHSVEIALGVVSLAMFIGTIVAVPVFLVKIPDDYFVRPRRPSSFAKKALRTVLGLALVALGLLMIVLPGQGVLTLLVGLGVLDLPIKHRIIRRILRTPKVHASIDRLRRKHGRGSLVVPEPPEPPEAPSTSAA